MKLAVVIMRIEHIAKYVNDLEATKESFIKYKRETRNKFISLKTIENFRLQVSMKTLKDLNLWRW